MQLIYTGWIDLSTLLSILNIDNILTELIEKTEVIRFWCKIGDKTGQFITVLMVSFPGFSIDKDENFSGHKERIYREEGSKNTKAEKNKKERSKKIKYSE